MHAKELEDAQTLVLEVRSLLTPASTYRPPVNALSGVSGEAGDTAASRHMLEHADAIRAQLVTNGHRQPRYGNRIGCSPAGVTSADAARARNQS